MNRYLIFGLVAIVSIFLFSCANPIGKGTEAFGENTMTIELVNGYSQINIPYSGITLSHLESIPEIMAVYKWNATAQRWMQALRSNGVFIGTKYDISKDDGLMIKSNTAKTVTLSNIGSRKDVSAPTYVKGYNLIPLNLAEPESVKTFMLKDINIVAVYKYNNTKYLSMLKTNPTTLLGSTDFLVGEPGEAYYIKYSPYVWNAVKKCYNNNLYWHDSFGTRNTTKIMGVDAYLVPCPAGCVTGALSCNYVKEFDSRCLTDFTGYEWKDSDNKVTSKVTCQTGQKCSYGETKSASGNLLAMCVDKTITGSNIGSLPTAGSTCTSLQEGTRMCNGNTALKCNGGVWVVAQTCVSPQYCGNVGTSYGCVN